MSKLITVEQMRDEVERIMANDQGYKDGKGLDMQSEFERLMQKTLARMKGKQDGKEHKMSEPREPSFEEDFDCDTDPPEWSGRFRTEFTLEDIAIEKGHEYAKTNAPLSRLVYAQLKEAYMQGFLQGFAHKMGGGHGDPL